MPCTWVVPGRRFPVDTLDRADFYKNKFRTGLNLNYIQCITKFTT